MSDYTCPECLGHDIEWFIHLDTPSVPAGSMTARLSEVRTSMVLGCNECSATIIVVGADEFLSLARRAFKGFDDAVASAHRRSRA